MPGHKTPAMKKKTSTKRSRSSAKKTTPAVRYLRYEVTNSASGGTETSHYMDLARDISIVNRRLYRQGRDYHVKKITIVSSNTPNSDNRVSVSTIPGNWVSREAWKRGFKTWTKMNDTALQQVSGDIAGTWSDFKVHMTNDERLDTKEIPLDNGGNAFAVGEWVYSTLVSPDGTTTDDDFQLHMIGDHIGTAGSRSSVGLIKSYGESRATVNPQDPNVPNEASSDPLVNVFDYGTTIDDVIDDLEFYNDNPPYDIAAYPGGDVNAPKPCVVQDTTLVDGRATMGGFSVLCGLLEFETKSPIPSDTFSILVELSPGSYRGIKADVI